MSEIFAMAGRLLPLTRQGWHWTNEGKLVRPEAFPFAEVPWIYHNMQFQCVKWHHIFFELITEKKMVHSHCHECYKVVIAPRTVEELMALNTWQATLPHDVQCKCGIELRDFVNRKRSYGGYFYTRGVGEGRERYKQVKAWAQFIHDKDQYENVFMVHHDEPMPVLLKNGCTEFEKHVGPSDKWEVTEAQEKLEADLDEVLEFDPFELPEGYDHHPHPEPLQDYVKLLWMRWAHHIGDYTYVQFMPDQKPLTEVHAYFTPPPVTYHGEEG